MLAMLEMIAGVLAELEAVARMPAELEAVAGVLAKLAAVAGMPAELKAVAGMPAKLEAVAGALAELEAVAGMVVCWPSLRRSPACRPSSLRSAELKAVMCVLAELTAVAGMLAVHTMLSAVEVGVACSAMPAKPPHVDRSSTLHACMDQVLLWYSGVTLAPADFDQLWTVLAARRHAALLCVAARQRTQPLGGPQARWPRSTRCTAPPASSSRPAASARTMRTALSHLGAATDQRMKSRSPRSEAVVLHPLRTARSAHHRHGGAVSLTAARDAL